MYTKKCAKCDNIVSAKFKSALDRKKYCSHSCQLTGNKFNIGKIPVNAFKKGSNGGEKNVNWKGDNALYGSKHDWIKYNYGKPNNCEECGSKKIGHSMHWANISGQFKRERSDWKRLCAKCHFVFDKRYDLLNRVRKIGRKKLTCERCGEIWEARNKRYKQRFCSRYCAMKGNTRRLNNPSGYKNKAGMKGVYVNRNGKKYWSEITYKGKSIYLGLFSTPEEAHAAYLAKYKELYATMES